MSQVGIGPKVSSEQTQLSGVKFWDIIRVCRNVCHGNLIPTRPISHFCGGFWRGLALPSPVCDRFIAPLCIDLVHEGMKCWARPISCLELICLLWYFRCLGALQTRRNSHLERWSGIWPRNIQRLITVAHQRQTPVSSSPRDLLMKYAFGPVVQRSRGLNCIKQPLLTGLHPKIWWTETTQKHRRCTV